MKPLILILMIMGMNARMRGADAPAFVKRLQYTRMDKDLGQTTGHGTAFAIGPRKLLTAAHNVLHQGKLIDSVRVELGLGWLACTVVRYNAEADIAVLSVEDNLAFAEFGEDPREDAGLLLYGSLHGDAIKERTGIVKCAYASGLRFLADTKDFGHGCSGGPVCQGKQIVGMMVAGLPKGGDMRDDQCYFVPASALKYFAGGK